VAHVPRHLQDTGSAQHLADRWVLQLIGVICVGASFAALYLVAQEPDYHQVVADTALYWGAGEALPQVKVSVGSCSMTGSRGSGGRYSADSRYTDCSVFLSGPADIIPKGEAQLGVRLYGSSATLDDEDAHGAGLWNGTIGVRWNCVTLLSMWGQFISVMWPLTFAVALGTALLWSPQLIAYMATRGEKKQISC